jgi:hypothetical protein
MAHGLRHRALVPRSVTVRLVVMPPSHDVSEGVQREPGDERPERKPIEPPAAAGHQRPQCGQHGRNADDIAESLHGLPPLRSKLNSRHVSRHAASVVMPPSLWSVAWHRGSEQSLDKSPERNWVTIGLIEPRIGLSR